MNDLGILLTFGLVAFVVAASLAWFRRHPMGVKARALLSVVVVCLVIIPPVVRGEARPRHFAVAAAVGVVLAAGVLTLHRRGQGPQPPE